MTAAGWPEQETASVVPVAALQRKEKTRHTRGGLPEGLGS